MFTAANIVEFYGFLEIDPKEFNSLKENRPPNVVPWIRIAE